jgi:hypothetical protein
MQCEHHITIQIIMCVQRRRLEENECGRDASCATFQIDRDDNNSRTARTSMTLNAQAHSTTTLSRRHKPHGLLRTSIDSHQTLYSIYIPTASRLSLMASFGGAGLGQKIQKPNPYVLHAFHCTPHDPIPTYDQYIPQRYIVV